MRTRVKDGRESKRRPVMGWIGVELQGDITPRESGQTSIRSFLTRLFGEPLQEEKQMTAYAERAGAPSGDAGHWRAINWAGCYREVRRLQASIVKAHKGRPLEQGESPAMAADPLVQRQSTRRQTGDGKPRKENTRGRQDYMVLPGRQVPRHRNAASSWLPAATVA